MRHFYRFATLCKANEITKSSVKTMGGVEFVHLDFCNTPFSINANILEFLTLANPKSCNWMLLLKNKAQNSVNFDRSQIFNLSTG